MRAFLLWRNWAVVAAVPLLAAAVWMPGVMFQRNVFSYIVTFDITQSMDVEDVGIGSAPVSRLEFARAAVREGLQRLPCGSKLGWSIFTGQSTLLLVPPIEVCGNFDALLASLNRIGGDMRWTNWSRVAEGGVYSAVRTATSVGHDASVLFFTDGQEAPPVLPGDQRVRDIPREQVKGWLIGVGGDQPVPIPRTDRNGKPIGYWRADEVIQVPAQSRARGVGESHEELSELRGQYLSSVAKQVGFEYCRLRAPQDLIAAMMDKRYAHRERVPTSLNWIPAVLALVLLVWRFLPRTH
ncbi:VWA domain-containing protein [Caballeronia sp. Lep1P3]|uniref:VWA domain-containing protein n=1 Tax=Caballeronia sp. Lep1P3 TaxID=2878150 RepID=UPI00025B9DB3|nr:VWA domain-containing protein [Caballeronia sp. Lep1P3]EKS72776.1 putative MxaL-like protein [Burkholderia sp. SJ98]